jgi:hypothetical protein
MHVSDLATALVAAGKGYIGVVVRQDCGVEFTATDPSFALLDGSRFRRLEQLEQAARTMARAVGSPEPRVVPTRSRGAH